MNINAENTKLMIWQTAQMASRGRSKLKGISLEQLQASSILEELFQMKTKNKYCTGHCCSDKAEAYFDGSKTGHVAQSVGHLTRKSQVLGSIPGLATYFRFSFRCFKRGSCQLLAKVCARSTG